MSHRRQRRFGSERYCWPLVFLRGWIFGALGGAVAGGVVATFMAPIIGTVFGMVYGVVIGALVGIPCALTLMLLSPILNDALTATVAGSIVSVGWSIAAVGVFDLGKSPGVAAGGVLLSSLVGAWVAPRATFRRVVFQPLVAPVLPEHAAP